MHSKNELFTYERIDSIPLIISLAKKLNIDVIINKYIQRHGNMLGIGYGELTIGWLAFILTQANHRKSHVEKWSQEHPLTLKAMLSPNIRDKDFSDDRLSNLLKLLNDSDKWHKIEEDLWKAKIDVFELPVESVRLDATNTYGYHEIDEKSGLMQLGFSKEGKHDLPLLKLMAGVEGNTGSLIASDVVAGNKNDDILYLPLIQRIKPILGKQGLLYCGDSKMSSLGIREYLDRSQDYYLTPLQRIKGREEEFDAWIKKAVDGQQPIKLVWKEKTLLGGGFEFNRDQANKDTGYKWKERVIVFRSLNLATTQIEGLEKRLKNAETKIAALTSQKKGKKPKDLQKLKKAVETILKTHDVEGLIRVNWKKIKIVKEYQRTEIRRGKKRNGTYGIENIYYELTSVIRDADTIQELYRLYGWRIYVTNMSIKKLSMDHAIIFYRDGWKIERMFHFLKSHPIGIQPLYVKGDDQLKGLFRLLTIALRLWTHMEMQVHKAMEDMNISVKGIYKGQPQKTTKTPSGELIVTTFENLSIMRYNTGQLFITTPGELSELFMELLNMKSIFSDMLERIKKDKSLQPPKCEVQ